MNLMGQALAAMQAKWMKRHGYYVSPKPQACNARYVIVLEQDHLAMPQGDVLQCRWII